MTEEFDFFTSVSWTHLIFFAIAELLLIGKCIYEKLKQVMRERSTLISVEVLPQSQVIHRKNSKKNMRQVLQRCGARQTQGALFDQTWYQRRAVVHDRIKEQNAFTVSPGNEQNVCS